MNVFMPIVTTDEILRVVNGMSITNRRGDLKNLTKQEFVDVFLTYADEMFEMNPENRRFMVELEDGRVLTAQYILFPANRVYPELREWMIELYTLKQKTPRSLKRFHIRKAWMYLAPYDEDISGKYKTDPTGKWSYHVWE